MHVFTGDAALTTVGTQTITATDTSSSGVTGSVVVAVPVTVSIPTNLVGNRNGVVTVPIDVNALYDPIHGNSGLSAGSFVVVYNSSLFTVANSDINLGSLTSAAGWSVSANTTIPGSITIAVANNGTSIDTGTAGGSLVTINFHVAPHAAYGTTAIELAANTSGGGTTTSISDRNSVAYTLLPAPQNGTNADDGLITITGPEFAPVAANYAYSITARGIASDPSLTVASPGVLTNDTDADGSLLTAILVAGPSQGTVAFNADGSFVYTPKLGYLGPDSFTYMASDGVLDSTVATVNLTITARLSIPTNLSGDQGGAVVVPVNIDNPDPMGTGGLMSAALAIDYNPAIFTVGASDVQTGAVTSGWTLATAVNAATGQLGISLSSSSPVASTAPGSLALITFHIKPGATLGASAINLAASNSPGGSTISTSLGTASGPLRYSAGANQRRQRSRRGRPGHRRRRQPPGHRAPPARPRRATRSPSRSPPWIPATIPWWAMRARSISRAATAQAALPADITLTNGVGIFTVALKTAGNQSLSAADTVVSGLTATTTVTVAPLAASSLIVSAPAFDVQDSPMTITVTAQDSFGNICPNYAGTVHFMSTDNGPALPCPGITRLSRPTRVSMCSRAP